MNIRKKLVIITSILMLMTATLTTAVLFDFFESHQEGDIVIHGSTCLVYLDNSSLTNISIPLDITNMSSGEFIIEGHYIDCRDKTNSYLINFTIDDSWFENPSATEYGFTYGVKDWHLNDMTSMMLNYSDAKIIYFWYQVDGMMMTPPSGTVHPIITLKVTPIS